jgi:hypothetical protein
VDIPQEAVARPILGALSIRLILWRRNPPRLWDLDSPQLRQQSHALTRGKLFSIYTSLVPASIQNPISLPIPTVASFPLSNNRRDDIFNASLVSVAPSAAPPAPAPSLLQCMHSVLSPLSPSHLVQSIPRKEPALVHLINPSSLTPLALCPRAWGFPGRPSRRPTWQSPFLRSYSSCSPPGVSGLSGASPTQMACSKSSATSIGQARRSPAPHLRL